MQLVHCESELLALNITNILLGLTVAVSAVAVVGAAAIDLFTHHRRRASYRAEIEADLTNAGLLSRLPHATTHSY